MIFVVMEIIDIMCGFILSYYYDFKYAVKNYIKGKKNEKFK